MWTIKKFILALTVVASLSTTTANAHEYTGYESCGGVGYEESIAVPSLTPYIALVTVAAIVMVAVAIRHAGHSHSHNHCH